MSSRVPLCGVVSTTWALVGSSRCAKVMSASLQWAHSADTQLKVNVSGMATEDMAGTLTDERVQRMNAFTIHI
ncbi:MAG: hypothetical protein JKY23_04320 [Nitrospinaceae bacterium]|nr:hypothetical protein [Nitrospinaceae bacterium]